MNTKKQLRAELEKAQNQIKALNGEIKTLKDQRTALVNDKMAGPDSLTARLYIVYKKLAENITKSLDKKNIINMNETERDDLYFMLERFMQMSERVPAKVRQSVAEHTLKILGIIK
jgi:hypothetical protein